MKRTVKRSYRVISAGLIMAMLASMIMISRPATVKAAPTQYIGGSTLEERVDRLISYLAATDSDTPDQPKGAMGNYAARLIKGVDTGYAETKIRSILTNYPIDGSDYPFTLSAIMFSYLVARDQYSQELADLTKEYLKKFPFHRDLHDDGIWENNNTKKDTYKAPNYELMTYGTGFLAAEQWADFTCKGNVWEDDKKVNPSIYHPADFTNGEIKEYCAGKLTRFFDSIPSINIEEHGPIYYAINMYCIKMLADFAQDPVIQKKAQMALDWMLLSLAGEWNNGYWIGTSDRSKDLVGTITSPDAPDLTMAAGWLYFGGKRAINAAEAGGGPLLFMAYQGRYKMPDILYYIANDRTQPFVKKESMLAAAQDPDPLKLKLNKDKKKYTYQSQNYGLSSEYDFTAAPMDYIYKEQRRKMLKWVSNSPLSTFVPMLENRNSPKNKTGNAFGYGESAFEQVLQDRGTLIGVYNTSLPYAAGDEDYGFYNLYAPFSKTGSIVKKVEQDGWIFCHGGSMLFAFKSIKPYIMDTQGIDFDVLWCTEKKNGWILETSELAPYATGDVNTELEAFKKDVLAKTSMDISQIDQEYPRLVYKSLSGSALDLTYRPHGTEAQYAGQCKIDGTVVDYSSYPMVDSPFAHQDVYDPAKGTDNVLTMNYKGFSLVYNFTKMEIAGCGTPLPAPAPISMPVIIPAAPPAETRPLPVGAPWYKENFESGTIDYWKQSPGGDWSVAVDGTYAAKQGLYNTTEDWFCNVLNSGSMKDMDVTAKVKVLNFKANEDLSYPFIGVRAADSNNMYFVALKKNAVEIRRRIGNNGTLVSKPYTIAPGITYDVRVTVKDYTISLFINGVLEVTAIDSALSSGAVAFGTAKAAAEFDDIAIYNLSSNPIPGPVVYRAPEDTTSPGDTTIKINAEADTFAKYNDNSDTNAANNGTGKTSPANILIVKNDGGNTREAFLRFDLAPLAVYTPDRIKSVTLTVTPKKIGMGNLQHTLSLMDQDTWGESVVTWAYSRNFTAAPIVTNLAIPYPVSTNPPTKITVDVTPQILSKLLGSKKLSLKITSNIANTSGDVQYASREDALNGPVLTAVVSMPPPPAAAEITTKGLPSGVVHMNYGEKIIESANFKPTVTWSVYNGVLPAGLSFSSMKDSVSGSVYGIIRGTPTASGVYNFTVRATDGVNTVDKEFTLPVYTPVITPETAVFDRNIQNGSNIPITVTPNTARVISVTGSAGTLVPESDYTVDTVFGNVYSISKSFLNTLTPGPESYPITFNFMGGISRTAFVTIMDTTPSSDATLRELTLDQGTLTPVFTPETEKYTTTVSNKVKTINVTPKVTSSKYKNLTVNGTIAVSGDTYPIDLSVGENKIFIRITAEDGKTAKEYSITVNRKGAERHDSENTGGNEGSGGNNATNTEPPGNYIGKPVFDEKTGNAAVKIDAETVKALFTQVKADTKGTKTVTIVVPKVEGAASYTSVLPAGTLAASTAAQKIEIKTELGTVVVPSNMLNNTNIGTAKEVGLTIAAVEKSALPANVTARVGSKPIFDLQAMVDGQKVEFINANPEVTVSVPYKPGDEELKNPEHIVIWYVDPAGNILPVPNGRYIAAAGAVVFHPTHFGRYAVAFATKTFEDIHSYGWAKKEIEVMASKGVINGTAENTFTPQAEITRADFTTLLVRALGLTADIDAGFADVNKSDYYYDAVAVAKKLGIVKGQSDNAFNPNEKISRQDMMVMTARALRSVNKMNTSSSSGNLNRFLDKASVAPYAAEDIEALINEGLIQGGGQRLDPLSNTTRAEAAVLIYRLYNK